MNGDKTAVVINDLFRDKNLSNIAKLGFITDGAFVGKTLQPYPKFRKKISTQKLSSSVAH